MGLKDWIQVHSFDRNSVWDVALLYMHTGVTDTGVSVTKIAVFRNCQQDQWLLAAVSLLVLIVAGDHCQD